MVLVGGAQSNGMLFIMKIKQISCQSKFMLDVLIVFFLKYTEYIYCGSCYLYHNTSWDNEQLIQRFNRHQWGSATEIVGKLESLLVGFDDEEN